MITPGWLILDGLPDDDNGVLPSTGIATPGGGIDELDWPTASMAVILAVTAAAATAAAVGMELGAAGWSMTFGGVTACS